MKVVNLSAQNGILGGLIGGFFFGIIMTAMGIFPIIAQMIGSESSFIGLLLHILISAVLGLTFGLFLAPHITSVRDGIVLGLLYGLMWWILGALTIMPLILGMGMQFANAFSFSNLMSLLGHLIYGAVLGGWYVKFFTVNPLITDEYEKKEGTP